MAMQLLKLENLDELDMGKISLAFEHEMKRCVLDCENRPHDKEARKITLTLELKPQAAGRDLEGVYGEFEIKSKVPVQRSRKYHFDFKKSGALTFNQDSPDNADQTTLFDDDDRDNGKSKGKSDKE